MSETPKGSPTPKQAAGQKPAQRSFSRQGARAASQAAQATQAPQSAGQTGQVAQKAQPSGQAGQSGGQPRVSSAAASGQMPQGKRPSPGQTGPQAQAQAQAQQAQAQQQRRVAPARAGQGTPVIIFDNLTKVYPEQPDRPALQHISLNIYPGEFVFLVGHSGSGKSTFIRLLTRELTPTEGRLLVAGEDLTTIRKWRVPYLRRNIGCVFQDFKLLPNKSAFENVAFALEVIGKSNHVIKTQVPEVLRLVGLEDKMDKRPDQLSGGEQQRVSIARAIVNRPPVLICDEPTGNLDPQTSLGIMRLLDRINRTGTTIVVATHDREMVDSMRKRVIALDSGHLVRDEIKGGYGRNA